MVTFSPSESIASLGSTGGEDSLESAGSIVCREREREREREITVNGYYSSSIQLYTCTHMSKAWFTI